MLTSDQIKSFNTDGYIHLKCFFENEVKNLVKEIMDVFNLLLNKYEISISEKLLAEEPGKAFLIAKTKQPKIQPELYDAMKNLGAFYGILSHERSLAVAKQILKSDLVGIANRSYGIRIDNPKDDEFNTDWHQDFHFHLRSASGLVFWIPILDVELKHGAIHVLKGSHSSGPLKLKKPLVQAGTNNYSKYARSVAIAVEDSFFKSFDDIQLPAQMNDLVILDYNLVHKSGANISDTSRWTMQARYFDFKDQFGVDRGWPGSVTSDKKIKDILPEYWEGE